MFIKKRKAVKAYAYRMPLRFKTLITYNFFSNFTPDNCVSCKVAFVEHNSIFAEHCPMSGANIQGFFHIKFILLLPHCHFKANPKIILVIFSK